MAVELWIFGAYAVGSLVGWSIGSDNAFKKGIKEGASNTIDALIDGGYLKATKFGDDVELHKLDK